MALHTLEPERRTLHGHFSRDLAPVLTIDSGDVVRFKTLDTGWNLEPHAAPGIPTKQFEPRIKGLDDGHALCGPVAIRGAEPGLVLDVEILGLKPGDWAWNSVGGSEHRVNKRLGIADGPKHWTLWRLDRRRKTATDQHGHIVKLRPFLGVMGMPPPLPGIFPTAPPRLWGGNLDCKELVEGSHLYLPISVPGGLFSAGDGHAAQGDGEVSVIAMECPMERADLRLTVRDDLRLNTPRAETPNGWLTLGFDEDVNEAAFKALEGMIELISERYGIARREALALAGVTVDLRITQLVNGTCGVHAVLPHGSIA
jgi:acetamidase/formamidase